MITTKTGKHLTIMEAEHPNAMEAERPNAMEAECPAPDVSQVYADRLNEEHPERDAPPPYSFPSPYFNPHAPIEKHENDLPHWQQGDVWIFVTFRMGDSMPAEKLSQWRVERDAWLAEHPEPWDENTAWQYHLTFTERMEMWLDAGEGSCALRDPGNRNVVEQALRFFDGERYNLDGFVIMPNHAHALFRPMRGHSLSGILHSWKSYTSKILNKRLGKSGTFWQEDYWDRLVRSAKHMAYCRRYIAENPEKARLREEEFTLWMKG